MGIERVIYKQQALSLPLEGIGAFPHPTQPRVLWIGPSEGWQQGPEAGRLTALHRAIEDCCRARGFAADSRPFSPHLTLARIKEGGRQVGQALVSSGMMDKPGTTTGALPVEAISLMKSELEPTGSIYTKLWEVRINRL